MTSNYKFLVVEDEPLIRRNIIKKIDTLQMPLEFAGEAGNGQCAVELVEQAFPDLVITDIRMPVMDGLALIRLLYEKHPQIKSIILSGYDDFKYAQEALKYGVSDFLLKPVKPLKLKSALQRVLLQLDAEHQKQSEIGARGLSPDELGELLVDYLRTNYHTDIVLSRLAEQFGFTAEYITKVFKKHTGDTPLKYLTKLRINEAKQILVNQPSVEIKKVGELVGYMDSCYFSRVFKANTGEYPTEYRSRMLV